MLVVIGQVNVLAIGNPSKEIDILKGMYEALERKWYNFRGETHDIREKVCCVEDFQEEVKVYDHPSTLVAQIVELESSL